MIIFLIDFGHFLGLTKLFWLFFQTSPQNPMFLNKQRPPSSNKIRFLVDFGNFLGLFVSGGSFLLFMHITSQNPMFLNKIKTSDHIKPILVIFWDFLGLTDLSCLFANYASGYHVFIKKNCPPILTYNPI